MKYFKNLKQYNKWMKEGNTYHHMKNSLFQYKLLGFNWFTGKIQFKYNNCGIFGYVEEDASRFN